MISITFDCVSLVYERIYGIQRTEIGANTNDNKIEMMNETEEEKEESLSTKSIDDSSDDYDPEDDEEKIPIAHAIMLQLSTMTNGNSESNIYNQGREQMSKETLLKIHRKQIRKGMNNDDNKDAIISTFGGIDIMLDIIMESDYIMDEAQIRKTQC